MSIKEKMMEYARQKGESIDQMCEKIGASTSNFRGRAKEAGLNSDTIINFLTSYKDCSSDWLLRDEGEMLRNIEVSEISGCATCNHEDCIFIKAKQEVIEAQRITIEALQKI